MPLTSPEPPSICNRLRSLRSLENALADQLDAAFEGSSEMGRMLRSLPQALDAPGARRFPTDPAVDVVDSTR
jgi:hypothetical protein